MSVKSGFQGLAKAAGCKKTRQAIQGPSLRCGPLSVLSRFLRTYRFCSRSSRSGRGVLTKPGLYYCPCHPFAAYLTSAPRLAALAFIFDFAVRCRSRPDKGRRRGLLWLALGSSVNERPLRSPLALAPQRPGLQWRWGRCGPD